VCRSSTTEREIDCSFWQVVDNEYLADFYQNMAKYSFQLQVYLLNHRFRQHQEIIWCGKGAVQDRSIYEDAIFAKVCLMFVHVFFFFF
jgi:deoxyadenosine/deoxycytidine kinase